MTSSPVVWALVPAAGVGQRMRAPLPKQYLPLAGKTVIQTTLEKLAALPQIRGTVVALAEHDIEFAKLSVPHGVVCVTGGDTRAASVLNGLQYLMAHGFGDDWVLVHDAARPCVRVENIARLMAAAKERNCGGILAAPVADTLKKAAADKVVHTVSRIHLWAAHTPQMFRIHVLYEALTTAVAQSTEITDEASAIEFCGGEVLLVPDSRDNIKITQPEDLWLAEQILQRQRVNF